MISDKGLWKIKVVLSVYQNTLIGLRKTYSYKIKYENQYIYIGESVYIYDIYENQYIYTIYDQYKFSMIKDTFSMNMCIS